MQSMKKLLGLIFLVAFSLQIFGTDLQMLADRAAQGNKILNLQDVYILEKPLLLTEKHSGLRIVGGGHAVISGGVEIKNWKKNGKFFEAPCELDKVESLFVNGKRATVAQSEEIYYFHSPYLGSVAPDNVADKDFSKSAFAARSSDLEILDKLSDAEKENLYFDVYMVWINAKCKYLNSVKNKDGTSTIFVDNKLPYGFYKWDNAPRFRICNALALLDNEGEFFYDKSAKKIFYFPRKNENIKDLKAFAPKLSKALIIQGESGKNKAKDISIVGVKFQYGAHNPDEKWRQASQAAATNFGFIDVAYSDNIAFRNCMIEHCNTYGIAFKNGVTNSEISDCIIYDSGSGGIRIGLGGGESLGEFEETKNIKISNNIIYSYGRYDYAGVGIILFNTGSNIVSHNTIFDGYYTGISVGWTWGYQKTLTQNNQILDNRIFKIGHGLLSDMGGIYTLGDAEGSVMRGNEISDVRRHRYGGWGIYNDEGSSKWLVEKNYVHDTHEDGYFEHYGKGNLIRNNIFENGEVTQFGLGRHAPDSFTFERNIVAYSSPAALIRNNDRIQAKDAKFYKNIYWNKTGEVSFSSISFNEWKEQGQDKNSFVLKGEFSKSDLLNEAFKKIGFEIFDLHGAGVEGVQKEKLNAILKTHEFPPVLKMPPEADWDIELIEDLKTQTVGQMPKHLRIDSIKGGKDLVVLEENKKRFVRYTDSPCDDRVYIPTGYYTARLSGKKVEVEFDFRVNEKSSFFVELRGEGSEVGGPAFWVEKGNATRADKKIDLPKNKWLHFKGVFNMGANEEKFWNYKIYDADTEITSLRAGYHKGPIKRVTTLLVASMSNEDGDFFDIADINVKTIE